MRAPTESTLLRMAAISIAFLAGACNASIDAPEADGGARTPESTGISPPSAAIVEACKEYHAAHRAWFEQCEGHDLDQSTVDSLTDLCAHHAALPGVTVKVDQLAECASRF